MFAAKKKGKAGAGNSHLPPGGGRPPTKVDQEETAVSDGRKGISLADYNKWLIAEENWNVAEDGRQTLTQIRDFRRAVRQEHLERGRERTAKARNQRELALQKISNWREQKRSRGNEIKAQIGNWNEQISTQRRAWSDYGNALKTGLTAERNNTRKQIEQERSQHAKQLRVEREMQETLREEATQRIEEHNREQAIRIKAETASSVTDESKRLFFSQRKAIAIDVVQMEERWKQERAVAREQHLQRAKDGVAAAKATRGSGRDAKMKLMGERGIAAKELRDHRTALREQKADAQRKLQESARERRNEAYQIKFVSPEMTSRMHNHQQHKALETVMHDSRGLSPSARRAEAGAEEPSSGRPKSAPK